jgi:PAS domain-containing protein
MMGVVSMLAQTKISLASCGTALLASGTALVEGSNVVIAQATPIVGGQTVGQTALQAAGVAIIIAIGSILTPIAIEWIRAWGAAQKAKTDNQARIDEARLQADQREKENDFEKKIALLAEKAGRLDKVEAEARAAKEEAWQARINAEGYKVRLELLEGRALATTKVVEQVKAGVERNTGSLMTPTAAIVTDAFGKVVSVTGQIEFILHWKPEEVVGKDVGILIPMKLHPDPINHTDRSFDPSLEFHDKTFRAIPAITKEGQPVEVDIFLTRWFEKGKRGTLEGVRFGKIIKKHAVGTVEALDLFPPAENILPGFNRDVASQLEKNSELVAENNGQLQRVNEKLEKMTE